MENQSPQKAFTLIELMIAVAIMGILTTIAVPNFLAMQKRAYNSSADSAGRNAKTSQEVNYQPGYDLNIDPSRESILQGLTAGLQSTEQMAAGKGVPTAAFAGAVSALSSVTSSSSQSSSSDSSFTDCASKYCQTAGNCPACTENQTGNNSGTSSNSSNNTSNQSSSSSSSTPTQTPTPTPTPTPSEPTINSWFEHSTIYADQGYPSVVGLYIKPTDTANKNITSFRATLTDIFSDPFSLTYFSLNLNQSGDAQGWNCSAESGSFYYNCSGSTALEANKKTILWLYSTTTLLWSAIPSTMPLSLTYNNGSLNVSAEKK